MVEPVGKFVAVGWRELRMYQLTVEARDNFGEDCHVFGIVLADAKHLSNPPAELINQFLHHDFSSSGDVGNGSQITTVRDELQDLSRQSGRDLLSRSSRPRATGSNALFTEAADLGKGEVGGVDSRVVEA